MFRFQYNKVIRWTCPIRTGSSFGKQGAVLIGVGIVPCKWGLLVIDIDEQMFYNWDIATGNVWKFGGLQMGEGNANDYKQKIIEIVNQIENIKILRLIFGFAKAGYEEEKAGS